MRAKGGCRGGIREVRIRFLVPDEGFSGRKGSGRTRGCSRLSLRLETVVSIASQAYRICARLGPSSDIKKKGSDDVPGWRRRASVCQTCCRNREKLQGALHFGDAKGRVVRRKEVPGVDDVTVSGAGADVRGVGRGVPVQRRTEAEGRDAGRTRAGRAEAMEKRRKDAHPGWRWPWCWIQALAKQVR